MVNKSWKYIPIAVKKQFYIGKKIGAARGYKNAAALSIDETSVIDRLTVQLRGDIFEASVTANKTVRQTWEESLKIGRLQEDIYRKTALESIREGEVSGLGINEAQKIFVEKMKESGITGFVDKAGKKWSLSAYCAMATRTTSRQAANLGTLFADEIHDLYKISSHGTTCPVCAPLEGRVYSRSGNDKEFPPLARAFGKIDPGGGNGLDNTYLNIHPNCRHVIVKYTDAGRSDEEKRKIREFSSFEKNPPTHDPRSAAQIAAYRKRQQARAKLLNEHKQFEKYRMVLGEGFPKTFQIFQKHKLLNSETYQKWQADFRETNHLLR
jgi:hypothetical protein